MVAAESWGGEVYAWMSQEPAPSTAQLFNSGTALASSNSSGSATTASYVSTETSTSASTPTPVWAERMKNRVQSYTCNGGANQKWIAQGDGSLRSAASGRCLDAVGFGTAKRDNSPAVGLQRHGQPDLDRHANTERGRPHPRLRQRVLLPRDRRQHLPRCQDPALGLLRRCAAAVDSRRNSAPSVRGQVP